VSAAAPWSVKGIDPKAREIAKDLARRSGLTLGEWLNSMIIEDADDDGYTPLPRRSHAADAFERRGRSRRLDDAYAGDDEVWQRLSASIDAIAGRLEAAERRSTIAIQGVDQAVNGLVRRLDAQEKTDGVALKRIDDIAEELREGHKRLRRFEQETGPKTAEMFGKVETSVSALAGRLYDIEERQRSGVNELRQRMDAVEKSGGSGAGAEVLSQVGQRLDLAQARTTDALRALEQSFAGLDQRLRAAEGRVEPEGVREAARFEKLAETLARQVEGNRADMIRRLDAAESGNRMERLERAVSALGDQLKASEQRSAQGIEAMGREVLRIGQNLHGRVQKVEADSAAQVARLSHDLTAQLDREMGRHTQVVEQRLIGAEDRHALALEKLGVEITRISDRLSDRIAQSERRAGQAVEEIGRRLSESSERIEQRYDRASGELVERMRLSEERTAALLAEAREAMEARAAAPVREAPLAEPVTVGSTSGYPPVNETASPADWRAAAFRDDFNAIDDVGNADGLGDDFWAPAASEAAPFPSTVEYEVPVAGEPAFNAPFETAPEEGFSTARVAAPFGGLAASAEPEPVYVAKPFGARAAGPSVFGGADVADVLAATAPASLDEPDDFAGETEFVDERALRAAAASGRAATTRQTIDAARAAMAAPAVEAPVRSGFGLKRGGKSRLQERLDKQAAKDGSTVRKALGASAIAVALTGGVYAYADMTGRALPFPDLTGVDAPETPQIAALATSAPAAAEARALFEKANAEIAADDVAGMATMKRAAEAGSIPAQVYLLDLYVEGPTDLPAPEARSLARRAAEAQDPRGMHHYAMFLYDGEGGAKNRPEALDWLLKAAGRGLVAAQFNVAKLYENGDEGIPMNLADAYRWYLIAAKAGDLEAQEAVSRLEPRVPAEARAAGRRAAEAFDVPPRA